MTIAGSAIEIVPGTNFVADGLFPDVECAILAEINGCLAASTSNWSTTGASKIDSQLDRCIGRREVAAPIIRRREQRVANRRIVGRIRGAGIIEAHAPTNGQ